MSKRHSNANDKLSQIRIFIQGLTPVRLFAVIAVIAGIAVRISYISGSAFPVNDGGLFFRMIEDLVDNRFTLPGYTSYNQLDIPFAYPPLGLYVSGLVFKLFNLSLFTIVKWLPCLVSILALISFYYFADQVLENAVQSSLAVLAFALIPRSFEWFIMGGGVTRSFGFLFLVLSMLLVWKVFAGDEQVMTRALAMVSAGLTILSHPEAGLYLFFASAAILLYHGITKRNIAASFLLAAGAAVVVSPWMISVINQHGWDPFLAAGGTGHADWFRIRYLLTLNFDLENPYFLSLIGVMALLGFFVKGNRRAWLFAAMVIGGYAVYPRGGVNYLVVPVSCLAAFGLEHILSYLDSRQKSSPVAPDAGDTGFLRSSWSKAFYAFVFLYLFLASSTIRFAPGHQGAGLSEASFKAITWLDQQADANDPVLLYPDDEEGHFWWNDYLSEWVPAITDLRSVTTVQGYEWLPGQFYGRVQIYHALRGCTLSGPECVREWEERNHEEIKYLVISEVSGRPNLARGFESDEEYELIYNDHDLSIFLNREWHHP